LEKVPKVTTAELNAMFDLHNDFALQFLSSCIPLADIYCELAVKVAYFGRFRSVPNTPHSTEIDHTLSLAVLENLSAGNMPHVRSST